MQRVFWKSCLVVSALGLSLSLSQPATAKTVFYGTGIHHWAKTCHYPNGQSTTAYVSAAECQNLPSNCTCNLTPHDFPVDNPYPYRVATNFDVENPSNVNVIIDGQQVIECGVTVFPEPLQEGVCGSPFLTVPVNASEVEPAIVEAVNSLRLDLQLQTRVPVRSFHYFLAQPLH